MNCVRLVAGCVEAEGGCAGTGCQAFARRGQQGSGRFLSREATRVMGLCRRHLDSFVDLGSNRTYRQKNEQGGDQSRESGWASTPHNGKRQASHLKPHPGRHCSSGATGNGCTRRNEWILARPASLTYSFKPPKIYLWIPEFGRPCIKNSKQLNYC